MEQELRGRAFAAFNNGNYDVAIEIFNKLIMEDNITIEDINTLGVAYFRHNDLEQAYHLFNELCNIDPACVIVRVNLAATIFMLTDTIINNPLRVVNELKTAIYHDPKNTKCWHKMAKMYTQLNDIQSAITAEKIALSIDDTLIDSHMLLGMLYRINGRTIDALDEFKRVLQLDQNNQVAKNEMCQILVNIKKTDAYRQCNVGLFIRLDPTMQKVCDGLYIGSAYAARNLDELHKNKITHILNVAKEINNFFETDVNNKFIYHKEDLDDVTTQDIIDNGVLDRCLKFIDDAINDNGNVFVHCQAGISRSGTFVIAYLMKKKKINFDEALKIAQLGRKCIGPNINFRTQLIKYFS